MARQSLRQKLPLGQIALFLAIALVCASYVAVNAIGADTVAPKKLITARMDDAGGISPKSPVTYRGVVVGTVEDVIALPGDDGVEVKLRLLERVRVPASTEVIVAQDTPVALKHIDLRPPSDTPPYLSDGDVVGPKRTKRPVPLETVLVNLMKLTDSLDMDDLTVVADELSDGLAGTAPHLERLADNGTLMVDKFVELKPTTERLIRNGMDFLETTEGSAARLPHLTKTLADVTGLMRRQTPNGIKLAKKVPTLTETIVPLIREQEPHITVMLANLITPAQMVSARIPALKHGLVFIPAGFDELTTIAAGDYADFEFVFTQGDFCVFDTKRRTPTDTSRRDPKLNYHCPSAGPTVRGAANAPRPGNYTPRPVMTAMDPATGRAEVPGSTPVRIGSSGGQESVLGEDSWQAIYLQGVQG